jgi:5-methylcytosine-specific restriction protein B
LYPNFDVLRRYHQNTGIAVDGLMRVLRRVNQAIDDPHYHVGISFCLRENLPSELADIWQMEIEPYLEEFFFDQRATYEQIRWPNIPGEIGW